MTIPRPGILIPALLIILGPVFLALIMLAVRRFSPKTYKLTAPYCPLRRSWAYLLPLWRRLDQVRQKNREIRTRRKLSQRTAPSEVSIRRLRESQNQRGANDQDGDGNKRTRSQQRSIKFLHGHRGNDRYAAESGRDQGGQSSSQYQPPPSSSSERVWNRYWSPSPSPMPKNVTATSRDDTEGNGSGPFAQNTPNYERFPLQPWVTVSPADTHEDHTSTVGKGMNTTGTGTPLLPPPQTSHHQHQHSNSNIHQPHRVDTLQSSSYHQSKRDRKENRPTVRNNAARVQRSPAVRNSFRIWWDGL